MDLAPRRDEIRLIKIDQPNPWTKFIGRSDSFLASDSDAVWQIYREVKEGTIQTSTYANKGSYSAIWSQRNSYFPAVQTNYSAFGQSMALDFESDTMARTGTGISIQLVWTGNNAGDGTTNILQSVNGTEWEPYPDSAFTVPITDGSQTFDITATSIPYFRVSYLKGANITGTMTIAYSSY